MGRRPSEHCNSLHGSESRSYNILRSRQSWKYSPFTPDSPHYTKLEAPLLLPSELPTLRLSHADSPTKCEPKNPEILRGQPPGPGY